MSETWPGPLPPCRCIDTGNNIVITTHCDLHNPITGLLVEPPVEFTGLLSVLDPQGTPDP
jgi:hypothetical protein